MGAPKLPSLLRQESVCLNGTPTRRQSLNRLKTCCSSASGRSYNESFSTDLQSKFSSSLLRHVGRGAPNKQPLLDRLQTRAV
jgi:hypothetical protein